MKKIRVLIVDDSAIVRQAMESLLNSDKDIEVIGTAADPYYAVEKIKKELNISYNNINKPTLTR